MREMKKTMTPRLELIEMTCEVVGSYVGSNALSAADLPRVIEMVHGAMHGLSADVEAGADTRLTPAVPIKKSVKPDHIVCLEDGRKFKSLKRHLRTKYDLSPDEYRRRWGLPADYPMVAPDYARERSELAKRMGLGLNSKGRTPKKTS